MSHHHASCKNCGTAVVAEADFCHHCGQSTHFHRFTVSHFLHEMFHAFTHADKGFFLLVKELIKRPGVVMYEYITLGKRKTYFNPFIFILLIGAIHLFASAVFKPYSNESIAPTQGHGQVSAHSGGNGAAMGRIARKQKVDLFMEHNAKMIMLGSVPMSAFIFFLFYRRSGVFYGEHLVAMCMLTGASSLIFGLVVVPLLGLLKNTPYHAMPSFLFLLLQLLYLGWGYQQFYARQGRREKLKPYLVSFVNIIAWSFLTGGAIFVYMAWPSITGG